MKKNIPYLYLFIIIINLALFYPTNEKNYLKNNFHNNKNHNFAKNDSIYFESLQKRAKRVNNTLFNKKRLADSTTTVTIMINGPKENAQIIGDGFDSPDHVYLNDNTDDLGSINTINLEQEGLNKIVMVWDTQIKNCKSMFSGCSSIISMDLSEFDVSSVTTMNEMFVNCSNLTSLNLGNFVTSGCKNMNSMFKNCYSLQSIDLSTFITNIVTNMNGMFSGCSSLASLDLSTFNTNKVANMNGMFSGCSSLTSLDLRNFDTSSLKYMEKIFSDCKALSTIDISSFNTISIKSMNSIFTFFNNRSKS